MQLVWGPGNQFRGLAFAANAAEVTYETKTTRSQSGRSLRYTRAVTVKGPLYGDGQAALAQAEAYARQALGTPYQDLVLLQDSGAPSAVVLSNRDSISGVVVVDGPHFLQAQGPEHVNMRTVEFTAEGEYAFPNTAAALVSYQETISVQGTGGPVYKWRFPINANPIRQLVTPFSAVRVVQAGQAVGHLGYPPRPAYAADATYLVADQSSFVQGTPRPIGPGNWVEWPVRWQYVFETAGSPPLIVPKLPLM